MRQRVNIIKTGIGERQSRTDMLPDVYTALIDEAHKRKLRVAAHLVNLARREGSGERRDSTSSRTAFAIRMSTRPSSPS